MGKIPKIILGFLLSYIIIFSMLFIYNEYEIEKNVGSSIIDNTIDKPIEAIMTTNKEKITKYQTIATKEEDKLCLSSINSLTEKIEETNYRTYKETTKKNYNKLDEITTIISKIIVNCSLSED